MIVNCKSCLRDCAGVELNLKSGWSYLMHEPRGENLITPQLETLKLREPRKDTNLMAKILSNTPQRGFGWTPDLPDHRDHTYAAPLAKLVARAPLPAKADLRKHC